MFPLHNKVSHKNHTHFRRSLNLCERTEECLFNNNIEHERVQRSSFDDLNNSKKQNSIELKNVSQNEYQEFTQCME